MKVTQMNFFLKLKKEIFPFDVKSKRLNLQNRDCATVVENLMQIMKLTVFLITTSDTWDMRRNRWAYTYFEDGRALRYARSLAHKVTNQGRIHMIWMCLFLTVPVAPKHWVNHDVYSFLEEEAVWPIVRASAEFLMICEAVVFPLFYAGYSSSAFTFRAKGDFKNCTIEWSVECVQKFMFHLMYPRMHFPFDACINARCRLMNAKKKTGSVWCVY